MNSAVDDAMRILKQLGYHIKQRFRSATLHVFMNNSQHNILSNTLNEIGSKTLIEFLTRSGEYGLYSDLMKMTVSSRNDNNAS